MGARSDPRGSRRAPEELWFTENGRDLSQPGGDDSGFEFEFSCQRCGDTWRSGFENYTLGRATGWLRRAGGMASNVASNVGWDVANTVGAPGQAQTHFHRCARCTQHVCDNCWNADRGLCRHCAPDLQTEVEQARAEGQVAAARSAAAEAGTQSVQGKDVLTQHQFVCRQCHAEVHGAKFCPACGHKLTDPAACTGCGQAVPRGAKFCPECGAPSGA